MPLKKRTSSRAARPRSTFRGARDIRLAEIALRAQGRNREGGWPGPLWKLRAGEPLALPGSPVSAGIVCGLRGRGGKSAVRAAGDRVPLRGPNREDRSKLPAARQDT
jgi:hypothetical protein